MQNIAQSGPSKVVAVSQGADADPRFRYATSTAVAFNAARILQLPQAAGWSTADNSTKEAVLANYGNPARNKTTGFLLNQPSVVSYDKVVDESPQFSTEGVMQTSYTSSFEEPPQVQPSVHPARLVVPTGTAARVVPSFSAQLEESGFTHNSKSVGPLPSNQPSTSEQRSGVAHQDYTWRPLDDERYKTASRPGPVASAFASESAKCADEATLAWNMSASASQAEIKQRFDSEYERRFAQHETTLTRTQALSRHQASAPADAPPALLLSSKWAPTAFVQKEKLSLSSRNADASQTRDMYYRPQPSVIDGSALPLPQRNTDDKDAMHCASTRVRERFADALAPPSKPAPIAGQFVTETAVQFVPKPETKLASVHSANSERGRVFDAKQTSAFVHQNRFNPQSTPYHPAPVLQQLHPTIQRMVSREEHEVNPRRPVEQPANLCGQLAI